LHTSLVQPRPSEQSRADPVQVAAAVHVSPTVQNIPSSQLEPVRGVHADMLVIGWHQRHELVGSMVPFA
jgi:hypothetical protein